jgi:hypothetical protein
MVRSTDRTSYSADPAREPLKLVDIRLERCAFAPAIAEWTQHRPCEKLDCVRPQKSRQSSRGPVLVFEIAKIGERYKSRTSISQRIVERFGSGGR